MMKSCNLLRYSYIETIRAHRFQILFEWQRIESQRTGLRNKYCGELKSSQNGPLMKVYLWFDLRLQMYRLEARGQEKLFSLRQQQEQQLNRLKKELHPVDY